VDVEIRPVTAEEWPDYLRAEHIPFGVQISDEAINVTFEQNVLTISGERKASFDDDNGTYHRHERAFGAFSRSFTLPATVDASRISAGYKDGVLTVRVPQREEAKPKQIAVDLE